MPTRHLVIISGIYLVFCAFYLWRMDAATYPGFPLDDSWIHQVFARNLATGHGFSFNPDVPIAGATAPLWTILLVPAWLLLGPITGGIALGMFAQWTAILAVYKLTELVTDKRCLGFMTGLLAIMCWPVIWGALSGMEIGLYSALSLWGFYFYFKSRSLDDRYSYISYMLFTFAFLARPECALFLAAAIIRDGIEFSKSESRQVRPWIIKAIIILLLTAPYFIFNYSTTGTLFPRTYIVKVRGKDLFSSLFNGDIKTAIKTLTVYPWINIQDFFRNIIKINPLIFIGAFAGIIKLANSTVTQKSKNMMLIALSLLYVPLIGVLSPKYIPTFQNFRYVTHLILIMLIFGTVGIFLQIEQAYIKFRKPLFIAGAVVTLGGLSAILTFGIFTKIIVSFLAQNPSGFGASDYNILKINAMHISAGIAITGALMLTGSVLTAKRSLNILSFGRNALVILALASGVLITGLKADLYANNVRNINECDVETGKYLATLYEPGDVVAVNDIGAIGYYSNMKVYDLKGLISPDITIDMLKNDSLLFEQMRMNKKIDYLAIAPGWYDYLLKRPDVFNKIRVFSSKNCTDVVSDTTLVFRVKWTN